MSRWERWTTKSNRGLSLGSFLKEQQSPAEMAQSMGLQSDGSGGYVDETGQIVARTVNNELVFYDPMGGAISAQSDGAELTQDQPSWADPITGEITVPPGKPESPEEIAAIPDPVPAQAPAGYSAFMNKKKKDAYADQTTPEEEVDNVEAEQEDPEMGFPDPGPQMEDYSPEGLSKSVTPEVPKKLTMAQRVMAGRAVRKQQQNNKPTPTDRPNFDQFKAQQPVQTSDDDSPVKPVGTRPADVQTPDSRQVERSDVQSGAVATQKPQLNLQDRKRSIDIPDPEQIDDEEMESIIDEKDHHLSKYDETIKSYREKLTGLSDLQNKNADKRYGKLRETIGNIKDPHKKQAVMDAVALAFSYTGRVNSGSGKNALGKVDHELLTKNKERLIQGYGDGSEESIKKFVESTRIMPDIGDDEVEAFFDALPDKLKSNFMGAGKISETYDGHYLGSNPDGSAMRGRLTGKTNGVSNGRLRGLSVAKLLLQQGGKDGYSGADLDLNSTDLEHVRGFNNLDDLEEGGKVSQEQKDLRENINNFILTASNMNQLKTDKNMSEFFDTEVHKLDDFKDEDFSARDELMNESNTVNDKANLVNQIFFDEEGNMRDNVAPEIFETYARRDRELSKDINKRINKFAKDKGIKLPNVKNRMGYEMIKKLGLGGYIKKKSGRGNQSKFDDKIYTAFLSTMMGKQGDERTQLQDLWKQSRTIADEASSTQNNDGAGKKALVKHLLDNGGIDRKFLEDKEFARMLKEETGMEALLLYLDML